MTTSQCNAPAEGNGHGWVSYPPPTTHPASICQGPSHTRAHTRRDTRAHTRTCETRARTRHGKAQRQDGPTSLDKASQVVRRGGKHQRCPHALAEKESQQFNDIGMGGSRTHRERSPGVSSSGCRISRAPSMTDAGRSSLVSPQQCTKRDRPPLSSVYTCPGTRVLGGFGPPRAAKYCSAYDRQQREGPVGGEHQPYAKQK